MPPMDLMTGKSWAGHGLCTLAYQLASMIEVDWYDLIALTGGQQVATLFNRHKENPFLYPKINF